MQVKLVACTGSYPICFQRVPIDAGTVGSVFAHLISLFEGQDSLFLDLGNLAVLAINSAEKNDSRAPTDASGAPNFPVDAALSGNSSP